MAKIHVLFGLFLLSFALVNVAIATPTRKYVGVYELKKGNFSVKITNWGARVISVILPDSKGLDLLWVLLSLGILLSVSFIILIIDVGMSNLLIYFIICHGFCREIG